MTAAEDPAAAPTAPAGAGIIAASWAGSALLAVTAGLAAAFRPALLPATVVDLALFAGGIVAFWWAYAIAVARSRSVEIGIGGLYFLQGTAPRPVRLRLLGSLAVEVVVALVASGLRPFSAVAFSLLAPLWGLGLAGLWGARHGRFRHRSGPTARG